MFTVGSLFSGIGGLDLGLERAGMTIRWQVEIDEWCRKVLAKNWPEESGTRRYGDVENCGAHNLERVDLIAGGDPCQDNSNSRRGGPALAPSLGDSFIRIVDELRPRLVLRENPTVVRADAPWPWWRFQGALERLGYAVLPFRLRACCFGFDHRRDRLFLLAELADTMRPGLEGTRLSRIDSATLDSTLRRTWISESDTIRKRNGIPYYVERIRGLGNAVVPQVAEWIGRRIMEAHALTSH